MGNHSAWRMGVKAKNWLNLEINVIWVLPMIMNPISNMNNRYIL